MRGVQEGSGHDEEARQQCVPELFLLKKKTLMNFYWHAPPL